MSAESGVPTFRGAGGLWRTYEAASLGALRCAAPLRLHSVGTSAAGEHRNCRCGCSTAANPPGPASAPRPPLPAATPQAFVSNPSLVWEFYSWRREVRANGSGGGQPADHSICLPQLCQGLPELRIQATEQKACLLEPPTPIPLFRFRLPGSGALPAQPCAPRARGAGAEAGGGGAAADPDLTECGPLPPGCRVEECDRTPRLAVGRVQARGLFAEPAAVGAGGGVPA